MDWVVRLATSDNTASLSSTVISPAKTWYKDSVFRIRLPHLAPLSSCHDMISGLYLTFALDLGARYSSEKEEEARRTAVLIRSAVVSPAESLIWIPAGPRLVTQAQGGKKKQRNISYIRYFEGG